jgi:hypothetical protein
VIGHAARRIRILGGTLYPTGEWITRARVGGLINEYRLVA